MMRFWFALLPLMAGPTVVSSARMQRSLSKLASDSDLNATAPSSTDPDSPLVTFPKLWFGLATAAAHVETAYPGDPWVAWAKAGHVAAYDSKVAGPDPDSRLRFLEEPEVELDLAAATGIGVFRMGVDWGRLVPEHPASYDDSHLPALGFNGTGKGRVQDHATLKRYREIILMAKERNMKVMLTLFHHAMPAWSPGGWLDETTSEFFLNFAMDIAIELNDVVDYWVTFNEPHVFVLLSNCAGLWPPGPEKPVSDQLQCLSGALPWVAADKNGYTKAMGNIEGSHIKFYEWAHGEASPFKESPKIGVAHNVALNEAHTVMDKASVMITESLFKFSFVDALKGHLDWLGLNYYSKEIIGGAGPVILDSEEYSESGRTVHPDGLFDVLMQFNERFPQSDPDVKFKSIIITENGVSDGTDILRPAYIVEHLLAVREAQYQGVPIEGYVHWTISDNWEWADGYCPKFGLVDVDRSDSALRRTKRHSYDLWTDIVNTGQVTHRQRDDAWEIVRQGVLSQTMRTFCRDADGKTGLHEPVMRKLISKDWRFSKLSRAEDQCHFTPWVPYESSDKTDLVAHTSSGTCEILGEASMTIPPHCSRSVWLQREKRCPDKKAITEFKGAVCEPSRIAKAAAAVPREETAAVPYHLFGVIRWGETTKKKKLPACNSGLVKPICCCEADGRCGFSKVEWFSCPGHLAKSNKDKCM